LVACFSSKWNDVAPDLAAPRRGDTIIWFEASNWRTFRQATL
jgi:hypothetical protein